MQFIESRHVTKELGKFTFSSQFDEGNAADFRQTSTTNHFEVTLAADTQRFVFSFPDSQLRYSSSSS